MKTKLEILTEDWGYDSPEDMVEDYMFDGTMPAICQNTHCNYSTDMEPDQDQGWCENCETNTLHSASVMMGII